MMPPKIDICIEGYNIEQTDFYIAHIVDKYNSLNELYQKSCEHIVFLEKECKDGFYTSLNETENRISEYITSIEKRIVRIESKLGISNDDFCTEATESSMKNEVINDNNERFMTELSDFHSELEDLKLLFTK